MTMQQMIPFRLQDQTLRKKSFSELLDILIASQKEALKSIIQARQAVKETLTYFNEKRKCHEYPQQDT